MYHQTCDWCEITESNVLGTLSTTILGLRLHELKILNSTEIRITVYNGLALIDGDMPKGEQRHYAEDRVTILPF